MSVSLSQIWLIVYTFILCSWLAFWVGPMLEALAAEGGRCRAHAAVHALPVPLKQDGPRSLRALLQVCQTFYDARLFQRLFVQHLMFVSLRDYLKGNANTTLSNACLRLCCAQRSNKNL